MRCETYPNFKDKVKIFDGCRWAQKDVINKCNIGFDETQFFFTHIKKSVIHVIHASREF